VTGRRPALPISAHRDLGQREAFQYAGDAVFGRLELAIKLARRFDIPTRERADQFGARLRNKAGHNAVSRVATGDQRLYRPPVATIAQRKPDGISAPSVEMPCGA